MKLLRKNATRFVFRLHAPERRLLTESLALYPLVPAAHHRIGHGKQTAADAERQHLLDEALAEHRDENRAQVLALLNSKDRFRATDGGFDLTLTAAEIEWLLQVLNDVRVGCWLTLGEPEPGDEPEVNEENARYLIAMELCGLFESELLGAQGVEQSPQWH